MGIVGPGGKKLAFGLLSSLLLVALLVSPAATSPRTRMAKLTNADREAAALDPLSLDRAVSHYAKRHSEKMARQDTLFHSTDRQLRRALKDTAWVYAAENVGVGASLRSLELAFMGSPDHRDNILNPDFDYLAVGVVRDDVGVWVTVIFYGP